MTAQQTAQTTQQTVQKIVNEDQKEIEANTTIATTAKRRTEAGSFWTKLLSDPLATIEAEVARYFPDDGLAAGIVKDLMGGLHSGRFDPQSSLATYSNSSSPAAFSGAGVTAGMAGGSGVAGGGLSRFGKVSNGPTDCLRNMMLGTIGTAARMAVGAVSPDLSAVAAAHQVMGALGAVYDKLVSALMLLPTETLSLVLTDKDKLLDQLRDYVSRVGRLLAELKSSDYGMDHQSLIREVIDMLRDAEANAAQVGNILLKGGNFVDSLWQGAERKVDDASVLLYDPKTLVPPVNSRQLTMAGQLLAINATIQVLLCRQATIERIYGNIAAFSSDIGTEAKFDNLFAPIIDAVSCQLLATIQDMEAALNKNSAFSMIMKEKEWLLQLRTILVFMRNAKGMSKSVVVPVAAQNYSLAFSESADTDNNANDFTALVNLINELKTQAAAAMTILPKNKTRIAKIVEAILVEIDRQKAITSRTEEKLKAFSRTAFTDDMTEAFTVANSLVSFIQSRNLTGIVKALKEGDVKGMFKSAFESSDEEKAMSGFVELIQYARGSMPEEVPALVRGYEAMRARARSDAIFTRLVTQSADKYIRNAKENRQVENTGLERLMNRITQKLGVKTTAGEGLNKLAARIDSIQNRIDSIGGTLDSALEQAIGVVTRPTQTKPVSCASR